MPQIPGYKVLRPIGRGAMGIVFEAFEPRLDRTVAIKVEHPGRLGRKGTALEEMFVEARAAARIGHPGVVPIHDVGFTVDGRPYYAMELVEGTDLETILRDGPMVPERVLDIGAQIARAVAAAHDRGIVHRDLKPANVLIDRDGHPRVLDFGMAMELSRDEQVDEVGGTLAYMSPEHLQGDPPAVSNDIYAIGVMLYEMLAGAVPFEARSARSLALDMEVREPPPLSKLETAIASRISRDVEHVVLRCLARFPRQRFESARLLADLLEGLLRGRSLVELEPPRVETIEASVASSPGIAIDPRPSRAGAMHFKWSVRLRTSPDRLWPAVSDTDRFNRAVGLTPVEYETASSDGRGVRLARTKLLGLESIWEEHPFEWVRDREHTVYRHYRSGPLEALWNRVSLVPTDDGGSEITHEVWALPRNLLGAVAARFELAMRFGPSAMRVYRAFDEAIVHDRPVATAVGPRHEPTADERDHVRVARDRLRVAHDPGLVERLATLVSTAPDRDVERIRPHALADAWGEPRERVLDLLLAAVRMGLLELSWDLVCPACGIAHDTVPTLRRVTRVGMCSACGTTYDRDLASSVELALRPHRAVRPIESQTYCIGAPAMRPHVIAQLLLHPGERRTIDVTLRRGRHRIVAPTADAPRFLEITGNDVAHRSTIDVMVERDGIAATSAVARAGAVAVTIVNASDAPTMVRVEQLAARTDALTAADALSMPALRALIGVELLPFGEHVSISRAAFLCVGLLDAHRLFDGASDPEVLDQMLEIDRRIQAIAARHRGATIETSIDRTTVVFPTAERAVAAALTLVSELLDGPLGAYARIAVHEGPCIALTRDDRLDYFGATVARASALLAEGGPGSVAISGSVADDPCVAAWLQAKNARVRAAMSNEAKPRRVLLVAPPFSTNAPD